jgi:hypothetical protein
MTNLIAFRARHDAPAPRPAAPPLSDPRPQARWVIDPTSGRPVMQWHVPAEARAEKAA